MSQPLPITPASKTARLLALVEEETRRGFDKPEIYRAYFADIEKRKQATLAILRQAAAEGKTVAAYGASTTTTTLLYHFEMGPFLSFIADDNQIKHGMYSPGWHIPVLPSSALLDRKPDLVVILAWVYAEPIIKRNQAYLESGGKFLIPLPDVKVVGA